jgi:hypothetical protein
MVCAAYLFVIDFCHSYGTVVMNEPEMGWRHEQSQEEEVHSPRYNSVNLPNCSNGNKILGPATKIRKSVLKLR